ncbi:MAG: tetratricopeptide repeat protein [Bernardetiaceae bacterium]
MKWIYWLWLWSVGTSAEARVFDFLPIHERVYAHYLRLEFEQGQETLQKAPAQNANTHYLQSYHDWFLLLLHGREEKLANFKTNTEERLAFITSQEAPSPYYRFLQAELYLQLGMAEVYFEKNWSAIWNIRRAYKLLQENHQLYPDFLPHRKSLGVLQVLFGVVPDKYHWALSLLGMQGQVSEGIALLQSLEGEVTPFGTEATLFLAMLQTHVLGQEQAAPQTLDALPPMGAVDFVRTITLLRAQRHADARALLRQRQPSPDEHPIPHWGYMLAETELHLGNFSKAKPLYINFLSNHQSEHFIKDTYYKLFLADWLGQLNDPQPWLQNILSEGKTLSDADRHALHFAQNPERPHPKLMKARLLTDGGAYPAALQQLQSIDTAALTRPRDRAEWWYRHARILHRHQSPQAAIGSYRKALQQGKDLPYHFAANAALQLGYIFTEQGENQEAKSYFEQVLQFKKHSYSQSLRQKAKTALQQLNTKSQK